LTFITPKKGRLLIAEVSLTGDLSFNRAVVLLVEHNADGSMGFILNKELPFPLSDLLPDIDKDFKVYKGGPVDQDKLFYVHKIPDRLPGSIEIDEGIFWGGDFEILHKALQSGSINPREIKFFLGYSGWMPDQLDYEIKSESWILFENKYDIITADSTSFWKEKLEELGGDYLIWANSPENPNFN